MLRNSQTLVNVLHKRFDISYPKLRILCQNNAKVFYLAKMFSFDLKITDSCNERLVFIWSMMNSKQD